MLLDLEASKLVDNNIKSLSLSAEATSETISNQIQQDLAQIHQTMSKEVLIKATKIAMENSQAIIDEHDHNQSHKLSFTKADLPSLSLALASEIVGLHYIDNKDDSIANVSNNLNLNSARHEEHQEISQHDLNNNDPNHSINMIRVAFKARIEQEGHNFEQHQQHQQVMQRQMSQH